MSAEKREINGRVFFVNRDYPAALQDKKRIDEIKAKYDLDNMSQVQRILDAIEIGSLKFRTVLGRDFADELRERLTELASLSQLKGRKAKEVRQKTYQQKLEQRVNSAAVQQQIDVQAQEIVQKKNKRRRLIMGICLSVAVVCIGLFGYYTYENAQLDASYEALAALKDTGTDTPRQTVVIHYTDAEGEAAQVSLDILDEYKSLYNQNQNLIGWIKIDDTIIDYPVLQCEDSNYYLSHNFKEENDRSGSIFMDPKCNVVPRSTNLILYGHHMQSGRMFGGLEKYDSKSYYEKHPLIHFDTIYEKGTYEIVFVFRSRVYNDTDVVFKYYQFIDCGTSVEFQSNMNEMRQMSLYDTGVNVSFGDQLLTLSTCDYQETNGRFVVVAKKIGSY